MAGIRLLGDICRNSGLNWSPTPILTGMMRYSYQFCMRLRYISLTLEEWGYTRKACLRRLNLAHLYKEMV